jgi:hypothetical protein
MATRRLAASLDTADVGETLRFLMGDQEVVMRVEEAGRPSRVCWSVLVCEPAPDWVGDTIVNLSHRDLPPDREPSHREGWERCLAVLVAAVRQ